MAITKTNFINYSRCPRYAALEEIKSEKLDADITYKEYKKEEEGECLKEILGSIFEDDTYEVDLTNKVNKQMEAMMPYYKMVEIEAGRITKKYFGGKSVYAEDTFSQESFEFNKNGIKYICYVDIYNEVDNDINIIEVKATTSNKYVNLKANHKKGEKYSIFHFDKDKNCYYLKDEIEGYPLDSEMPLDAYLKQKEKLFDRYSSVGSYIFDLAIQRFILEGEYKESHNEERLKNVHYYLAVLNHNYVFDGTYEGKKAIYNPDNEGNEIVVFFDLTKVTEEYQNIIKQTEASLEEYLFNLNASPCPMGKWCERKKVKECIYLGPVCGKMIPAKNSSLNYLNNGFGFKTLDGERLKGLELINAGYINMLDIPEEWITSKKHEIQRDSLRFNRPYIDTEKIRAGLNALEYPIYHLDFETMPCPMPRFRGEKPYIQSPFEFSLHIEHAPGVCDKEKDNYIFLAKTFDNDEREELVKALCKYIDPDKGTLFAQNVAFEKGRIKELASIFPEYREKLMKMYNRGFDLLWLVNTKTELYEELGFDKERASLPNYYNKDLSGSYSIKKTLPVFSDLSYKDLTVKNGTEAIVAYASYNKMTKEEYDLYYEALRIYCQQDTWAMVVILQALRELCQIGVKS
jgi:hypothetical protein